MSCQELEKCILNPDVDGTLGKLVNNLLLKPAFVDPDTPFDMLKASPHHIPQLCDSKDYKSWNEKLAKKLTHMHKLYQRFITRYELNEPYVAPDEFKNTEYSGDIMHHLINYDENCNIRFLHEDMKIFEPEILHISQFFQDLGGVNPFLPHSEKPESPEQVPQESQNEAEGEGEQPIQADLEHESAQNNPDEGKLNQKSTLINILNHRRKLFMNA